MPKPSKGPRLGSGPAHEKLLLGTLAAQLFEKGKLTTTEAKARRLRPLAERLITHAKKGDLPARRRVMARISSKSVVHTLFTEIAPRFATRDGGDPASTISITAIGALSPLRGPILVMRV